MSGFRIFLYSGMQCDGHLELSIGPNTSTCFVAKHIELPRVVSGRTQIRWINVSLPCSGIKTLPLRRKSVTRYGLPFPDVSPREDGGTNERFDGAPLL